MLIDVKVIRFTAGGAYSLLRCNKNQCKKRQDFMTKREQGKQKCERDYAFFVCFFVVGGCQIIVRLKKQERKSSGFQKDTTSEII